MSPEALKAELAERAHALGFVRAGVARAEPLDAEGERLRAWVARGDHATMAYMAETLPVRIDPGHEGMLPGARSVVVFAHPYPRRAELDFKPGIVARYAGGRDYHRVLKRKLKPLVELLEERGFRARPSVDSAPVYERAWAARAGVGFIGKNSCLIIPGIGSYVFLAAIVTDAVLEPDASIREGCGACTRCLDACPTGAFRAPRELDSRKCISYLTIEHRGPIPDELQPAIGDRLFGCDVCQEVCPFNQSRTVEHPAAAEFASDARWRGMTAERLAALDATEFEKLTPGSPLRRARIDGLKRNALVVLRNQRARGTVEG